MHAGNQHPPGDELHVGGEHVIALLVGVALRVPPREGVRRGRDGRDAIFAGQMRDGGAHPRKLSARLGDGCANAGADFHLRPHEFGADLADSFQCMLTIFEKTFGRLGDQITIGFVNEEIFFLNT
jgi:hypothetical protein